MKYSEFVKQAYHTNDISHPDNDRVNMAVGGAAGAGIVGGGSYLLAKLLKAKNAWVYGLGGAVAGGVGGALAGNAITDKWTGDESEFNAVAREADAKGNLAAESMAQRALINGSTTPSREEKLQLAKDISTGTKYGLLGRLGLFYDGQDAIHPKYGYRLRPETARLVHQLFSRVELPGHF